MSSRIATTFAALKEKKQSGFVSFITAGDPDLETCAKLLAGLPQTGVDILELGVPFSDPMADGVPIQQANLRALNNGITLKKVLGLVKDFRATNSTTPVVLMGYFNPVLAYGVDAFLRDAAQAGVDGLIIVDLPPEEDEEVRIPAQKLGLDFIRLIAPTTETARLGKVLGSASGFVYYVSVTGVTGAQAAKVTDVGKAVTALRAQTKLPVAIGFGIATPEQAASMAKQAEAIVVGSAIVNRIAANLDRDNKPKAGLVNDVLGFVGTLTKAAKTP